MAAENAEPLYKKYGSSKGPAINTAQECFRLGKRRPVNFCLQLVAQRG